MRSRLPCSHLTSLGRVDHHLGSGSKICWVVSLTLLCGALTCANALAQEAAFGVAMPLTITGGILDTGRAQMDSPSAPRLTAGFRALAVPEVKLGSHWYAYSAVQVRSTPFFYEDAYSADRTVKIDILQGFLGYTRSWHQAVFGMRIGQLTTAFGSFPLRYSDTANPLLDQPLAYTYLRIPFLKDEKAEYGIQPATLYGLPGAEIDVSWRRIDGRFQVTNSSPANPKGLLSSNQHAQWTMGGGYTLRQGLRVGVSAFQGPWLDRSAVEYLPPATSLNGFFASGFGVDIQWARGPWSTTGEWEQWSSSPYLPNRQAYEAAIGFRPNRLQLLKVGYEWVSVKGGPRTQDNVLGIQFVTSINSLSKAFK